MDRSDVAYLIRETWKPDEQEVMQPTQEARRVFVNVDSITGREWYEGARIGLNPEVRLRLFAGDYHGEDLIEWSGTLWTIYRVYHPRTDTVELYMERRKGTEDPQ